VDGEGYIRGVYNGTLEMDLERLKRHIEILKRKKKMLEFKENPGGILD